MAPKAKSAGGAPEGGESFFKFRDADKEMKLSDTYALQLDWQIYRSGQIPGPGAYYNGELILPKGGTISRFKPKGYCDDILKRAMQMPGPADYPAPKLYPAVGGKFNMSNPKTELDWIEKRGAETPGPLDIPTHKLSGPSGGRFNISNAKSEIDWIMYRGVQLPGPADYTTSRNSLPNGGKFSDSRPMTEVDWIQSRASKMPGPGEYNLTGALVQSGGKFNMSKPKSDLDWVIHRASQLPGPGAYEDMDAHKRLNRSSACRILGRGGPRNLPFPYGGAKPPPFQEDSYEKSRSSLHTEDSRSQSVPPGATGGKAGHARSLMIRPAKPSGLAGNHPLMMDPAAPRHKRWRKDQARKKAEDRALRASQQLQSTADFPDDY
mmetsp:Transcript_47729/g.113597  ORF Transcript_47729/g.113597 Transcript_47729/m.113597 type:complete len:378 (-) Transcript_47729:41-1174(-)